jgi:hypothetical protein
MGPTPINRMVWSDSLDDVQGLEPVQRLEPVPMGPN